MCAWSKRFLIIARSSARLVQRDRVKEEVMEGKEGQSEKSSFY